jgi:uncharacterized LabA/DUF88 family protein
MRYDIEREWMGFVDGENLTIEAQKIARAESIKLVEGELYKKDCFIWVPGVAAGERVAGSGHSRESGVKGHWVSIQPYAIRASYYTAVVGSDQIRQEVNEKLWQLGFSAQVFRKDKQSQKSKGVDIALTKDMLSHAFRGNFDVAVLVAGDADYVPLVEEVKSLGKQVIISFFKEYGLSPSLRRAADAYYDLTPYFVKQWKAK